MRKLLYVSFVLVLMFLVAACSNSESNDEGNNSSNNNEEATNKSEDTDFPEEPIEIVVPYDAGTTDTLARLMAKFAEPHLPEKQPIVIDNRPGGNAAVGTERVFNADPDGYTLLFSGYSTTVIRPHVDDEISFTHDSFQTIANFTKVPQILVTKKDGRWSDAEEFLEEVKNADEPVLIGSTGFGGFQHIMIEKLNEELGGNLEIVQFSGSSEVAQAVLGGSVDLSIAGVPNLLGNDDYQPLATVSPERSELLDDIPTLKELDIDVEGDLMFGLWGPKDMDESVLNILEEAFAEAAQDSEVIDELDDMGYESSYENAKDFQNTIDNAYEDFGNIIDELNLLEE